MNPSSESQQEEAHGETYSQCETLRIENARWRREAKTLLGTHSMLLKALASVALEGSRVVAEARGLNSTERRVLLHLFSSLHISAPGTEYAVASNLELR